MGCIHIFTTKTQINNIRQYLHIRKNHSKYALTREINTYKYFCKFGDFTSDKRVKH